MEKSPRFEGVVALGKRLVAELRLNDSSDTLGRWMAHYVAELIKTAEGSDKKAEAARRECADIILQLWRHVDCFPRGKRLFENLQPILAALESLKPDNDRPRYFVSIHSEAENSEKSSEADDWLKIASGIDDAAKLLIRYALLRAAEGSVEKGDEWVKLALEAGVTDDPQLLIIRFFADEEKLRKESDPNEDARKEIQRRLEKLRAFVELTEQLAGDLTKQLAGLNASSNKKSVNRGKSGAKASRAKRPAPATSKGRTRP